MRRREDFSERHKALSLWVSKASINLSWWRSQKLSCSQVNYEQLLGRWTFPRQIDYMADYSSKSLSLWKTKTILIFLRSDDTITTFAVFCFCFPGKENRAVHIQNLFSFTEIFCLSIWVFSLYEWYIRRFCFIFVTENFDKTIVSNTMNVYLLSSLIYNSIYNNQYVEKCSWTSMYMQRSSDVFYRIDSTMIL